MADTSFLKPATRIRGVCVVPGDKSLSHRALILASLADGRCRIENLGTGDDVKTTIDVLGRLGVKVTLGPDGKSAAVDGVGGKFPEVDAPLNCRNSGTTLRLMAGVLAGQPHTYTLAGDESLSRRPVVYLSEALNTMGAKVETSPDGTPPLTIHGGNLTGTAFTPRVASAQVKSAMLLAGLFAEGTTAVIEILATRDHTERLLGKLGGSNVVEVDRLSRMVVVHGGTLPLRRFDLAIPSDTSSAAYPIALAALLPESSIRVPYVGLNAGRIAFFRHLQSMGAHLVMEPDPRGSDATGGEPVGDIVAHSSRLRNVPLDPERIPAMIDELPLLGIISCLADGDWAIRDAERLRVKESDRVKTTAEVIRGVGGVVEEHSDGLSGPGNQLFAGGELDTALDHRIAMTAAVAAWCAKGVSTIHHSECVKISFPGFFERMLEVVES